jgi:uncharacterized protein DUF6932
VTWRQRYNGGHHRSPSPSFVPLPSIAETGDLPQGVHHASLREVLIQFGEATTKRKLIGMRLDRVYQLAVGTGHMKRFIVFGSFVTAKPDPNDVDVFLVMHDTFDLNQVTGEARLVFDHPAAQAHFGASIFWLRQLAALPGEEEAVLGWQLKRDGTRRGIVDVTEA